MWMLSLIVCNFLNHSKNKLLLIGFFSILIVFNVNAHSQSPVLVKTISLTGKEVISIEVGNQSKSSMAFDIEFDGEIINNDFIVNKNSYRNFLYKVHRIIPSKLNKHKLCSISKPGKGVFLRTRICSDIFLYYPKDKIEKIIRNNE